MATAKKRIKKMIRLRPELFWDVDPKTIDLKKNAQYVIERILDFGDDREVRWMAHHYPLATIKSIIRKSRVVHDKSKNLWSLVF
jgi:hypothetical protein